MKNKKTVLLVALTLFSSATTALGQSLTLHNVTVKKAITTLKQKTGYNFVYEANDLNTSKQVNVNANGIRQIVGQIIEGQDLDYNIQGKNIIISRRDNQPHKGNAPQQNGRRKQKVKGTIVDNNGDPIVGATIKEKGTQNGTISDVNGNYSLDADDNAQLEISYVGFTPQTITPRNGKADVTLEEDQHSLNEVVVVGYGIQKKVDVVGSISTVNSRDLESRGVANVSNLLTGHMSGVSVTQTSGNPGSDAGTIRIRGVGSFGASPSPMVLVDGMPGSLNDLSADDIENISVLKDASSAAIYGSRAANGVILVTTKQGRESRPVVSYNGIVGFSKAQELPELAHSWEYAEYYNMAAGTETYTPEMIQKYKDGSDPDNYADENYLDELLGGSAFQTRHDVSVTGGSQRVKYMASFGYLHQDGLLPQNSYNRYNARMNFSVDLTKKLKMTVRISGLTSDHHDPNTPGVLDFSGPTSIIQQAVRYPGLTPSYLQNGERGLGPKLQGTPVAWAHSSSFVKNNYDRFKGNMELSYTPVKGLVLTAIGGYTHTDENSYDYRADMTLTGNRSTGPAKLTESMYRDVYKTLQLLANYNVTIDKHNISALVGYTWEDENSRNISGSRNNFPSDDVPYLSAGGADGQSNSGGGEEWSMKSFFGRITYNYNERYLFEASARYDGSSRFPESHKWAFFPSVAVGWRVSEEKFWKDTHALDFFSNLKVKASYGVLGNNNIGNYPYQSVYTLGPDQNYVFGGTYTQGAAITTYVDHNLKWERTRNTDVGIETGFFNNKLTFNATYFYRKTTDVLYRPAASYSDIFGLRLSQVNTGAVENKGWEFEIGHQNNFGQFNYNISANFSIIKNKVLTLGMGNVTQENGMVGNGSDLFIGYPMQMFYGYKTDGVFLTDDEVAQWYDQSSIAPGSKAGDVRYVDTNGDNKVTSADRVYLGSRIPKYNFGLNLGFNYKGFDFTALLQGVAGVKGRLSNYAGLAFRSEGTIQKWQMEGCWNVQKDNRYPEYPRLEIMSNSETNNTKLSDFWLQSAWFLKVRNIQVGYTLPRALTNHVGVSSLRIFVSLDNVLSFDSYHKGWDPENTDNYGTYYPTMKSYTLGLSVKF